MEEREFGLSRLMVLLILVVGGCILYLAVVVVVDVWQVYTLWLFFFLLPMLDPKESYSPFGPRSIREHTLTYLAISFVSAVIPIIGQVQPRWGWLFIVAPLFHFRAVNWSVRLMSTRLTLQE